MSRAAAKPPGFPPIGGQLAGSKPLSERSFRQNNLPSRELAGGIPHGTIRNGSISPANLTTAIS
jgi:hypothetical protein